MKAHDAHLKRNDIKIHIVMVSYSKKRRWRGFETGGGWLSIRQPALNNEAQPGVRASEGYAAQLEVTSSERR
jgi:hypothetical protein